MTLSDLLDLEAQLARDREADPAMLEARDRRLFWGRAAPGGRAELIHLWLAGLREREPAALFPGGAVTSALAFIRGLLVLAGLVLGWGAASGVMAFEGGLPVNVWDFLLGFVGLQLLLLVLLITTFLLPLATLGAPLTGMAQSLIRAAYPWLVARGLGERAAQWRATWHRLRSRGSLYHRVEPWVLLGLTQSFGVAFNVGALLALARLVVFTDIAFAWSTTLLELDAPAFHALTQALSAPFGWAFPRAVPSLELIEATRYSRLEGTYLLSGLGRSGAPQLVGGWWPFLTASLAAYGLLPRLSTLALSGWGVSRALARLPLDDVEVSRLLRRLAEPHVETRNPSPADAGRPEDVRPLSAAPEVVPSPGRCAVVLWRDLAISPRLEEALERTAGCGATDVHSAGGVDFEEGSEAWSRRLAGADRVALVAEGWEAPDRAVCRILAGLRRAAGPQRPLTVWLIDEAGEGGAAVRPAPDAQLRLWREVLGRLEDPYLAVEPLGGAS
jgi:hypothetical protein